eukprot:TRINITY_DN7434_c0_g1_i1.p1 TRINITY_DN7434_c0_g1~~TRINITY_DN7434_c0_g1_i1.p1  ORF type:complete len:168 (+),score=25.39 TRINITY_DN7434_c0_g1_i1:113-616(+)
MGHLLVQLENYEILRSAGLLLDKQKAILVLYCLVQFRNRKAQVFNVLYLAIAMVICNKCKGNPGFTLILQQFIDLLRINASFENLNDITDGFFSTETKSTIADKKTLYRRAYNHCRKLYPGIITEIVIVKIHNVFKELDCLSEQTEDTQTAKSLLMQALLTRQSALI